MSTKKEFPIYLKLVIKALIFLLGSFLWLMFVVSSVSMYIEEATDDYGTDAYNINRCDEHYYEKEYVELYEYLCLHEAYDEIYDVYWEVVNAYIDTQEYIKWSKVETTQMSEAADMQQYYKERVLKTAQNTKFPQNQKYLDGFVEMLN